MNNQEIRNAIRSANLKYWQVAEALSMSDGAFSRKLRKEFSPDEKKAVLQIIQQLKKEAN